MLKDLPKVLYNFENNITEIMDNYTIGIYIENLMTTDSLLFRPITVYSTDTPEIISYNLYGTSDYWWTLLLVNNIVNPFEDWIRETNVYAKAHAKHHNDVLYYKDIRTNKICDDIDFIKYKDMREKGLPLPEYIEEITRFVLDDKLNTGKSFMYAINPDYIFKFVDDMKSLLESEY